MTNIVLFCPNMLTFKTPVVYPNLIVCLFQVCLVTDPRAAHPYGALYTVDCLGNVVGGRRTLYNNQEVRHLRDAAARSVQGGEAVWFGCDVNKRFMPKMGIEDIGV